MPSVTELSQGNLVTGGLSGILATTAGRSTPCAVMVTASEGSHTGRQTFQWYIDHIALANPGEQINAAGDTVSLPLLASAPGNLPLTYTATGLPPGLTLNPTSGVIGGTVASGAPAGNPFAVTVTASDGTSNTSQTFSWVVSNGQVTLTSPGNQSAVAGSVVALPVSASDPGGGTLSYTASGLPLGLSIDAATGLISGTLDLSAATTNNGQYPVTLLADNGTGSTSSLLFTWTVTQANLAPQTVNPGSQSAKEGDAVSLPIYAFDPNGDTLSFSATGLPSGLSIGSTTGVIAGTVAAGAANGSPYSVTVTASDGTLNNSQTFAWVVSQVLLAAPGDQTTAEGQAVSLQLQATASAGAGAITYGASNLPAGLTLNTTTGLISGSPANLSSNSGPYTVTATATAGGSTSSQSFTWNVTHVLLSSPGDQFNTQGDTVSVPLAASDPDSDTLSYSVTGLPSGLGISSTTGLISGTIATTGQSAPYAVTVTASDGSHSASATFKWTVNPVLLPTPGDQFNVTGNAVSVQVQGSEGNGHSLTYSASGLPAGLSISSAGLITGTLLTSAARANPYAVTVTASNGTQSASTTFNWSVQTLQITGPGDQSVKEGGAVSIQVQAYGTAGAILTYAASALPPGLSINPSTGLISGTLASGSARPQPYLSTVVVSSGNGYQSGTLQWTVSKVTLTNPGSQIGAEGSSVSLALQATPSDGSPLTYGASGLPAGLSISSTTGIIAGTPTVSGTFNVTATASDGGTTASQSFSWALSNGLVSVTNPGTQNVAEGAAVSLQVAATDPQGYALTYSVVGLPPGLSISASAGLISGTIPYSAVAVGGGSFTAVVQAADSFGQSVSFVWNVSYTDTVPTITNPGNQSTAQGAIVSLQLSASDADGEPLTYSATGLPPGLSVEPSGGLVAGLIDGNAAPGPYSVTVSANDGSDSASASFTWTVTAVNPPPVFNNLPDQYSLVGQSVAVSVSAYDPKGATLTYAASGLPPGLSMSAGGQISGAPSTGASSTPYTVTVTATDPWGGQASVSFQWQVVSPTLAPGVRFVDATGSNVQLINPVSADELAQAIQQAMPGGTSYSNLANGGYGAEYLPALGDLVAQLGVKLFWAQVDDQSGQPGSTVTIQTLDDWGTLLGSVTVPIQSVSSGVYRTTKPLLAYEGQLTPQVQSLLSSAYALVAADSQLDAHYSPRPAWNADHTTRPLKINAVGDSLTAAVADGILTTASQRAAYPSLIAKQLDVGFNPPDLSAPILPESDPVGGQRSILANFHPATNQIDFGPDDATQGGRVLPPFGRWLGLDNAGVNNFAVPGAKLKDALTQKGVRPADDAFPVNVLLGIADQITQARKEKPSLILAGIGGNDALSQILTFHLGPGQRTPLTPMASFFQDYQTFVQRLSAQYDPLLPGDKPNIVLASIPDPTVIPFLYPIGGGGNLNLPPFPKGRIITAGAGRRFVEPDITAVFPILKLASQIMGGGGNFPAGSRVTLGALLQRYGVDMVAGAINQPLSFPLTEVLQPADLSRIQFYASVYNRVIRETAWKQNIPVVGLDTLFGRVGAGTYQPPELQAKGIQLNFSWTGGLFGADGIHPTFTGQAAVANEFINVLNAQLTGWGGITQVIQPLNLLTVLQGDRNNSKKP